MTWRKNPAVMAGLLGGVMLAAVPASVQAATFEPSDSPVVYAAIGAVGGLSCIGMVSGIAWLIGYHAQQKREELSEEPSSEAVVQYESKHSHGGSQNADISTVIALDRPQSFACTEYKPRHMRTQQWSENRGIRVQHVSDEDAIHVSQSSVSEAVRPLSARPKEYVKTSQKPLHSQPRAAHAAKDYEQVAENYLKLMSFRERMASRARGAAEVLKERLGGDPMEGLPVIPRADGTVGDVGTSWWNTRVGEKNIARDFGITAIEAEAIPDEFSSRTFRPIANHTDMAVGTKTRAEEVRGSKNDNFDGCDEVSVADRVAFVDQGMFPEKRTVSELSHKDDWELALDALDAKLGHDTHNVTCNPIEVIPATSGIATQSGASTSVGTSGSLGNSDYIRSTYIEHLVADVEEEMQRAAKKEEQRPTRELFRLIDGGTHSLERIPTPATTPVQIETLKSAKKEQTEARSQKRYCPKHFSTGMQEAIEA